MSSVPGRDAEVAKPSRFERLASSLNQPTVEAPRWLVITRQVVVVLLGVWIISYSVTASSKNIAYIITGLILLGIIPVEYLLLSLVKRSDRSEARRG